MERDGRQQLLLIGNEFEGNTFQAFPPSPHVHVFCKRKYMSHQNSSNPPNPERAQTTE